jgi:cell wall-associated NlpC family hydrolase
MKYIKAAVSMLLSVLLASSLVSFAGLDQREASYEMYVNDQKVGLVKYAARGLAYYDAAMEDIRDDYPEDVSIRADVYFKEVKTETPSYTSESQIAGAMKKAVKVQAEACAININGETLCYVRSAEEAEALAEAVKKPYVDELKSSQNTTVEEAVFSEEFSLVQVTVDYEELISADEALELLQQRTEGVVEHIAGDDDTFWGLAREMGMDVDEIIALNPDINPNKIRPGQVIKLSAEKKLLNVITKEVITYQEDIPFDTKKQDDNTLLQGNTKTVQKGKNGKQEIQARIIRENGREIEREIIQTTTVEDPVDEIIAIGTKKPPTPKPTPKPTSKPSTSRGDSGSSGNGDASPPPSNGDSPPPSNGSVTGTDVVNYAKKFLGRPYVYGANGPKAFDCSGFTSYVYKHFGYSLYRSALSQLKNGTPVSKSNLAPGDLVIFKPYSSRTTSGHVGIYIGNNQMIHASSTNKKVEIRSLDSGSYPSRYLGARRILK